MPNKRVSVNFLEPVAFIDFGCNAGNEEEESNEEEFDHGGCVEDVGGRMDVCQHGARVHTEEVVRQKTWCYCGALEELC